jgi:hypothetical protein
MRNRLAWLGAVGVAGVAAYRRLRRQPADDPAAELRRKLDESRDLAGERDEFEAGETPVDEAEAPAGVDERRRAVHERGRSAVDEMRGGE